MVSYHHKEKRDSSPDQSLEYDEPTKEELAVLASVSTDDGAHSADEADIAEPVEGSPIDSLGSDVEILGPEPPEDDIPDMTSCE